ncbi:hypothetical protein V7793_04325 [Streptomyces sp. KLMMK]|uniref:hypothetical protein n=1 Tax=Streptomyces sp. KLMMK TaxID=3109353 RepID=UPI002FFFA6F0
MPPGQARPAAVLALVLDAAARSGEPAGQCIAHLAADNPAVRTERRPQHGAGDGAGGGTWVETSASTRAAPERRLPVRADLVARARGASRLWVSFWMNHDGVHDGNTVMRPARMPLEENRLVTSCRTGCLRYRGTWELLPLKLEQLRRRRTAGQRRIVVSSPAA